MKIKKEVNKKEEEALKQKGEGNIIKIKTWENKRKEMQYQEIVGCGGPHSFRNTDELSMTRRTIDKG